MNGEWVHDTQNDVWHLVWEIAGEDAEEGVVTSWCHKTFRWDDPHKSGKEITWADTLHDECVRQSAEL